MSVSPICTRCNSVLEDWIGNVMVDNQSYPNQITGLHVLCKRCTREMDSKGIGSRFHNLWELSWVKETPMTRLASILHDLTKESDTTQRWEIKSVKEVGFLIALTMPYDEGRSFLRYLNPHEADFDGEYLNRLKERHGLQEDH